MTRPQLNQPPQELPLADPAALRGMQVSGVWRARGGRIEARRFGGAWHEARDPKRGPSGTLLAGGVLLVQEQQRG